MLLFMVFAFPIGHFIINILACPWPLSLAASMGADWVAARVVAIYALPMATRRPHARLPAIVALQAFVNFTQPCRHLIKSILRHSLRPRVRATRFIAWREPAIVAAINKLSMHTSRRFAMLSAFVAGDLLSVLGAEPRLHQTAHGTTDYTSDQTERMHGRY